MRLVMTANVVRTVTRMRALNSGRHPPWHLRKPGASWCVDVPYCRRLILPFGRRELSGHGGRDGDENDPNELGEFDGLDNDDERVDAETHKEMLSQYNVLPVLSKQVVFVIQPFERRFESAPGGHGRVRTVRKEADVLIQESKALVDTLGWDVVGSVSVGLPTFRKESFFGSGMLETLKEKVGALPSVTAIFLSTYKLNAVQRTFLEEHFNGLPIIDRYSLVLQIFQRHARTREARLQVALAEIPYLKQRLMGDLFLENRQKHSSNRRGSEIFERKSNALRRQEQRIVQKLADIRKNRGILRKLRVKKGIPSVAVVGYTNAGKTSLIKALTGSHALLPRNQLFATLDVTVHQGFLPSTGLKSLFVDTVGFISDIPTSLIASFSATLEDASLADLIVHVRDVSHPDTEDQCTNVLETLLSLGVPQSSLDSLVTAGNKMDLLPAAQWPSLKKAGGMVPVSATEGFGVNTLAKMIERRILELTGRRFVRVRCRTGSEQEVWLTRNATVTERTIDQSDHNYALLCLVVNEAEFGRLRKYMQS